MSEPWNLDADGKRLWDERDPTDCWNIADLAMDREALRDYLNDLERRLAAAEAALREETAERIRFGSALEHIAAAGYHSSPKAMGEMIESGLKALESSKHQTWMLHVVDIWRHARDEAVARARLEERAALAQEQQA